MNAQEEINAKHAQDVADAIIAVETLTLGHITQLDPNDPRFADNIWFKLAENWYIFFQDYNAGAWKVCRYDDNAVEIPIPDFGRRTFQTPRDCLAAINAYRKAL
jgi:hypothetical protein